MAKSGITPLEIELAFLIFCFKTSVNIGVITTPPPSPDIAVTAMSGLGGGVVMTPIFTDVLKQNIKKASSISNGVIPLFAITVGVYNLSTSATEVVSNWQIGYIIIPLVLPMIL